MGKKIAEIINERSSCRSYNEKEIPEDILEELLNLACKSPSSGGFQALSIIKVTNKEKKKELVKLCRNQRFIEIAPANLIFCIDFRKIKRINDIEPAPFNETNKFANLWMGIIDAAICAQTFCLAAEEYGLKSVYIGNMVNYLDKVSDLLKIPKYVCPVIMVVTGYPKLVVEQPKKYNSNIIVHDEEYRDIDIDELLKAYRDKYSNQKISATARLTERLYQTARIYHGEEYADKCKQYVQEEQIISPYQYWFGCYYLDNVDFMEFEDYAAFMNEKGFRWMKDMKKEV